MLENQLYPVGRPCWRVCMFVSFTVHWLITILCVSPFETRAQTKQKSLHAFRTVRHTDGRRCIYLIRTTMTGDYCQPRFYILGIMSLLSSSLTTKGGVGKASLANLLHQPGFWWVYEPFLKLFPTVYMGSDLVLSLSFYIYPPFNRCCVVHIITSYVCFAVKRIVFFCLKFLTSIVSLPVFLLWIFMTLSGVAFVSRWKTPEELCAINFYVSHVFV